MSNTAIEFNHVGKQYRLGTIGTGTISHDLNRWWARIRGKEDPFLKIGEVNDRTQKANSEFVWALKDIDFKVEQGDVLGIIGKNGAGKSTLLKVLSRVTSPTTGTIRARGRIASLLEVGTGFHPEMTGRENIFMNGSIMGMTKAEITRKLDEIVNFAGVEKYIDTPVKRYSSGMTVRLGFAIAAHLEPEILVVDEVLAVGDAEFQKKAIGKMQDISHGGGRTVLFVSHNMNAVRNLCKRGIVLDKGGTIFDGPVNQAVEFYLQGNTDKSNDTKNIKDLIVTKAPYIRIDNIIFNGSTDSTTTIQCNQKYLDIIVEGETSIPIKTDLSFTIRNLDEVALASLDHGHFTGELDILNEGRFKIQRRVILPKYFYAGECMVDINMHQPGIVSFFSAPRCVRMNIEGNLGDYGRALQLKYNGLIGLESISHV